MVHKKRWRAACGPAGVPLPQWMVTLLICPGVVQNEPRTNHERSITEEMDEPSPTDRSPARVSTPGTLPARQAAALSVTTSTVTLISLETRHRVGISSPRITTRECPAALRGTK
uniref:Secreted protein n=1 Tax=Rousettus aegyptiacus TaxID=9407 RepID=A0A7J8HSI8_ROUAE|nr:hypothetical protein HJG63_011061 [Rousettus aegyptiacus]